MSKASKRQKLTEEEKKKENQDIRRQIKYRDMTSKEDRERIVNTLRTENIIAYAMVLFLPPVGVWYIWTRREKLYLNRESVYLWTFVGAVILYQYIQYAITHFLH